MIAEHVRYTTIASPIGALLLTSDPEGECVTGLYMESHKGGPTPSKRWEPDAGAFRETARQISAYFAGELRSFDVPVRLVGTDFQLLVWEALREIPFGETVTYGDLAGRIGCAGSARAVGAANGRNPVSIIVPCHRVIGSSGSLTGYGGGLDRKRWLLQHERAVPTRSEQLLLASENW